MIVFKNEGEIDERAIKVQGCSVKKEDAIGFFGTGLKYAIAVLLREGIGLKIYSGLKEIVFEKKPVNISGKNFDIVTMNGDELGFTTELGKNWELWQAMREIYCNCTDEGGEIFKAESVKPQKGFTTISVDGPEFEALYDNIGLYILQGKPDIETDNGDIRLAHTHSVFYKNVRVIDGLSCMFTYNIKNKIDLTEDRTAKYNFQISREVSKIISKIKDKSILERILCAPKRTLESELCYDVYDEPTQEFIEVCSYLAENQNQDANKNAIDYAKRHSAINDELKEYEPTQLEKKMIERAMELLLIAGYKVNKYPVKYVETLGESIFAQAKNNEVLISKVCFTKGTKFVAHALLEETMHLDTGFHDETRQLQTHLFDNILTLVERLNQEAF